MKWEILKSQNARADMIMELTRGGHSRGAGRDFHAGVGPRSQQGCENDGANRGRQHGKTSALAHSWLDNLWGGGGGRGGGGERARLIRWGKERIYPLFRRSLRPKNKYIIASLRPFPLPTYVLWTCGHLLPKLVVFPFSPKAKCIGCIEVNGIATFISLRRLQMDVIARRGTATHRPGSGQ